MAQKISVDLDVQEAKAVSAWLRYRRSVEAVNQEMSQTGRIQDRNKRKAQGHLATVRKMSAEALTTFTGIGSVISGIALAAAAINQQHQILIQRQKNKNVTGKEFGEVVRDVRVAFEPDKSLEDKDLETKILEVAKRTRTNENIIGASLVDTFSAKGAKSNQKALEAVEAAFLLKPNDLEAGRTLAARALDLSNAFGIDDMKANVGFLQNIQQVARLTSLEKVGANLLPGIISVTQQGDTPEQAAELGVTLTKLMTDAEGRLTRTALINMSSRLADFVPSTKGKDKRGKFDIPEAQVTAFDQAKTTTERVAVMQQSPELQRQFFSEVTFDAASSASIRSLLTGSEVAQKQLQSARDQIKPLDINQVKTFEEKVSRIEGGSFQNLVRADEQSQTNQSAFRLSDRAGQIEGAAQKIFEKTMSEVSASGLESALNTFGSATIDNLLGINNIESQIRTLENIKFGKTGLDREFIEKQLILLNDLNQQFKSLTEESDSEPSKPSFLDRLVNSKVVRTFTGERPAPTFEKFNQRAEKKIDQLDKTLFGHTQALKENTAALEKQNQSEASPKPVKVEVKLASDTSTIPNGPRASSALARPAK
ncbi:hypothetical protein [Gimesia aquarii]|uniref:Phage-related minor tail protein n=1 Tax=Gimesia aquarii TaxID=2527964 RepID=A0A517VRB1_9PLAN|nr:hypothetical protein [Gimesia aquarii]QDT95555.1 hypothetical protein V144x_10000 [Gimesia aquarii]